MISVVGQSRYIAWRRECNWHPVTGGKHCDIIIIYIYVYVCVCVLCNFLIYLFRFK